MSSEFRIANKPNELKGLLSELRRFSVLGVPDKAKLLIKENLAKEPSKNYRPMDDIVLLELHAVAAAVYDDLEEYDAAQNFVFRWASKVQFQVVELRNKIDSNASNQQMKGHQDFHGTEMISEGGAFWHVRGIFLEQCGVAMYRMSKFDAAREYLKDSCWLSSRLLKYNVHQKCDPRRIISLQEAVSAYASNSYWLGCAETYANDFDSAEGRFLSGLQEVSERLEVEGHGKDDQFHLHCTRAIGHLLLGLGLLRFHKGVLTPARSDLLASKIMFAGDPGEYFRRLRADLLLLSVERSESGESESKLREILKKLRDLAKKFEGKDPGSAATVRRHQRYYARTQWTIGKTLLDLADIYRRSSDQVEKASAEAEKERIALLESALEIAESETYRSYGSQSDQLQLDLLRIRVLRRLGRFEKAAAWGRFVIERPGTIDHPLLNIEILIALGHVCYNLWKIEKDSDCLLEAKQLISKAAESSVRIPKLYALAKLHLARIAKAQGEEKLALKEYENWTQLAGVLANVKPVELFSKVVADELQGKGADSLVFKGAPEVDAYPAMVRRLKQYLMDCVEMDNKEAAAAKLGVSRQTLHAWARELQGEDNVTVPKGQEQKKKGSTPQKSHLSLSKV